MIVTDKRNFTKGEEIFSAVTHIVGGGFSILGTAVLIVLAVFTGNIIAIVASAIYGSSLIILYSMSSIYHFLRFNRAKKVFRILDHCSIYFLIAGTYTPFCLISLHSFTIGVILFILVWAIAVLGIVLNSINMRHKAVIIFSQISYLAMGWCVVLGIKPLIESISLSCFAWLLAGGLMYTIGVIFFALSRKIKYFHSVWHFFVMAGSALQYVSVFMVVRNLL